MAHPDLHALLDELLPLAEERLKKHGSFNPYGSVMAITGEIFIYTASRDAAHATSQQLMDFFSNAFRQQTLYEDIRAVAVCYDVKMVLPGQTNKSHAICVRLEHHADAGVTVYLPYHKSWLGIVHFGEMLASQRGAAASGEIDEILA